MSYKIVLNSILLIPFLVMIESCMTPTPISPDTQKKSNSIEEPKDSSYPEGSIPKIEVNFLYSKDGGTSFKPLKNVSQLYSGDRLKIKIIPKEDAFIKILLINNTGKRQRLDDRQYGLTKLKKKVKEKKYSFPAKGSILLDKTKAKETICVLAFADTDEQDAKSSDNCDHGNVVNKVSYQLN